MSAPSSGRAISSGPADDSWSTWWLHNREAYFEHIAWANGATDADVSSSQPRSLALGEAAIQGQIVPALLAALEHEPSTDLRRGILLSLAKIGQSEHGQLGGSELQDLLLGHLTHKNQLVAETACVSLGVLDRPDSLPLLASLLQDGEPGQRLLKKLAVPSRMRAYAAYGIGLLAERSPILEVRQFASHVLTQALAEECGTSPDVHAAAVISLGMAGRGEAPIETLLGVLGKRQEHDQARAHAPAALAKLCHGASDQLRQRVLTALLDYAGRRSETASVQEGCILALGRILRCGPKDAQMRLQLMNLAKRGKTQERAWAMLSLAQIAARPELGAADQRAGSFDIQNNLLKSLTHASSNLEAWAALSLGILAHGLRAQGESVPSSLGRALRDGLRKTNSPDRALAYGIALGLTRDPDGLEALQGKLAKFDLQTRATLVTAMGLHGDPAASPALLRELHEARHTPAALISSAHALALLRNTGVVDELNAMFDDCSCLLSTSGITTAMARTRHPAAVAPLLAQLGRQDASDSVRTLAVVALGNLAEKAARPWRLRLSEGVNYRAYLSTLTESDYGILLLP